jgi:hypothetical protein
VRNKRRIKLVKSNKQIRNVAKRMDNPRAAVFLSPWEIKVSGLPQADHKHNLASHFKLKRVLVCIRRATKRRSGGCLDSSTADSLDSPKQAVWRTSIWLYSRWLGVPQTVYFTGSAPYLSLSRSVQF